MAEIEVRPCCYDCLSEDVTVKIIDPFGFEHWFCAADWAAEQAFGEKIEELLKKATDALKAYLP